MRSFILIVLIFLSVLTFGKNPKVKTVTSEYFYTSEKNELPVQAELKAIEKAKIKALEDEFGRSISGNNITFINNQSNQNEFYSFVDSDVNGEWIETIEEKVQPLIHENELVYHAVVKGKIREIINSKIDIDWTLLVNGTDLIKNKLRNNTYQAGDNMYLYFKSPVDGFLAVYLCDSDQEHTVQCLIPYRDMNEGIMKIEADKPYIFFSKDMASHELKDKTHRLKMNSHSNHDLNRIYLIFSPNPFTKTNDEDSTDMNYKLPDNIGNFKNLLPRQTDFTNFQKWLGKLRRSDIEAQVVYEIIVIEKD